MNRIVSFLLLFTLTGCALDEEAAVQASKEEARYFLTVGKCSQARSTLNEVSYQSDDASFVSLYASTYACDADFSELTFFQNLEGLDASGLLNSLANFPTSDPSNWDQDEFENLMLAITILITSNGATPSTRGRATKFGATKGTDLSLQAVYMIMTGLGRFFAYHGNTDADGVKGAGTRDNVCITDYEFHPDVATQLALSDIFGCNVANGGSEELNQEVTEADRITELCYGIVLFNNLLEIMTNITLSDNDSNGDLENVGSEMDTLFAAAETAEAAASWGEDAVATLKTVYSQSACEENSLADILRYYLLIFETNLNNTAVSS